MIFSVPQFHVFYEPEMPDVSPTIFIFSNETSTPLLIEKHPYAIKGQLYEELVEGGKRTKRKHFGLSSSKTPPTILELKPFEADVIKREENSKFGSTENHFQDTLVNDLKKVIHLTKCLFSQIKLEPYMKVNAHSIS